MKCLAALLSLLSLITAITYSPPVIEITDEYDSNLQTIINTGGEAYLVFHAAWCGACHRFKPYYQMFAEAMAETSPSVQMLSADNDLAPKLVSRFQIAYLPSLFHIREGKVRNISDHRGDLEEYVKKSKWQAIPPITDFLSPYSALGNVLALIGGLGFAILTQIEGLSAKTGIPTTALVAVLVAIFFFIFIQFLASMLRPSAVPAPQPEHQKKD